MPSEKGSSRMRIGAKTSKGVTGMWSRGLQLTSSPLAVRSRDGSVNISHRCCSSVRRLLRGLRSRTRPQEAQPSTHKPLRFVCSGFFVCHSRSSIGRVSVSKTEGCEFDSHRVCQFAGPSHHPIAPCFGLAPSTYHRGSSNGHTHSAEDHRLSPTQRG